MQSRDVSKRLSTFFLCLLAIVPYTTFSHLLYHHHIGTLVGTLYRVTMYIVTKMKGRKKKKKRNVDEVAELLLEKGPDWNILYSIRGGSSSRRTERRKNSVRFVG